MMTNGVDVNPPPAVDMDDVNGKLLELQEINSALVQRCGGMRGQIIKKDQEISRLQLEIMTLRQNADTSANENAELKKQLNPMKEVEGRA